MLCRSLIHYPAATLLEGWLRERHRGKLRVLMFHGLTDKDHAGLENCQHKHLHVARFEAVAAHLSAHYNVMSMDDLVERLENGSDLPPCPAVLTFDDGFASNYHLAYPVLRHYGLPSIIYLATDFVDGKMPLWVERLDFAMSRVGGNKADLVALKARLKALTHAEALAEVEQVEERTGHRLGGVDDEGVPAIHQALNWDQVREMAASGLVTFGSHTRRHVIMSREEPETMRHELLESRRRIESETGQPCVHFCYPNGTVSDFSETSEQIVRECGFRSTVTTVGGLNPVPCSPFLLRRLGITDNLRPPQFRQLMAVGDPTLRGLLSSFGGLAT